MRGEGTTRPDLDTNKDENDDLDARTKAER
jgi:hypothetical protein